MSVLWAFELFIEYKQASRATNKIHKMTFTEQLCAEKPSKS